MNTSWRTILLACLWCFYVSVAQGQKRVCTVKGCGPQIEITMRKTSWDRGAYRFQFLNDRGDAFCQIEFILKEVVTDKTFIHGHPTIQAQSAGSKCNSSVVIGHDRKTADDPKAVSVSFTGSENPTSIQLFFNGKLLFEKPLGLDFLVYHPNGPRCAPECRRSSPVRLFVE